MKLRINSSLTALGAVLSLGAGPALAQAKVANGMLTDAKGMTLYVFDKDAAGKSNCSGGCAAIWPPLAADEAAKPAANYTVIAREDGKKQVAYKGKPLYTWVKDQKPGDTTGDGVGGAWHIAKP